MSFVGNLLLFAAMKEFCNRSRIDKVIAMVRVAPVFDSQCRSSCNTSKKSVFVHSVDTSASFLYKTNVTNVFQ